MNTVNEIIEAIKTLKVPDLVDLVKTLEEEFGVSATPMVVPIIEMPSEELEVVEEQTEFSVHMESFGEKKIEVIRAIRSVLTELGLKEAKDLVESVPVVVKEGLSKSEADSIIELLTTSGAEVTLR